MMTSHFKPKYLSLTLDPVSTILIGSNYIPSPNFDARPEHTEISLLVIHGISLPPNQFDTDSEVNIVNFFTNKLDPNLHPYFKEIHELKVSCHCLITRTGKLIQFVPFKHRAWHAGKSDFAGKTNCNDFSIGIELEGSDEVPYTAEQYQTLKVLIEVIRKCYPKITADNIVGHCHIAPDRKTDPGKLFDWEWVKENFK